MEIRREETLLPTYEQSCRLPRNQLCSNIFNDALRDPILIFITIAVVIGSFCLLSGLFLLCLVSKTIQDETSESILLIEMFGSITVAFANDFSESENKDTRLGRRNLRNATSEFDLPQERKEVFKMLLGTAGPRMKLLHPNTHTPTSVKLATFLTFLATGGYQASQVSKVISIGFFISSVACVSWKLTTRRQISHFIEAIKVETV